MTLSLGCLLAIVEAKKCMSQADQDTVTMAMSLRGRQLEQELDRYSNGDDAWPNAVIDAAHKVLGLKRQQAPWIRCAACNAKSFNSNDIGHRYCGRCHKFHETASDYELSTDNPT